MLSLNDLSSSYPAAVQPSSRFILREYLQCKILEIIYTGDHASQLVFIGGTCLRLLYGNQRFSEDLDFDHFGMSDSLFDSLAVRLEKELSLQGFEVEMRQVRKGAWHCYLKFPNLLFQSGLSRHRAEKILIQIDAEAQGFAFQPESRLLRQFDVFTTVPIPPLSLLLSHKIAAILNRPRNKGRDFFDLIFLHPKTRPDYAFLDFKFGISNPEMLRSRLLNHCSSLNFKDMAKDVETFLFHPKDIDRILLFPQFLEEAEW